MDLFILSLIFKEKPVKINELKGMKMTYKLKYRSFFFEN